MRLHNKNISRMHRWWRNSDQKTIVALLILCGLGLILVTTSGYSVATKIGLKENYFASRQLIYIVCALTLMIILSGYEKKILKRIAVFGFILNIFLLILVKFYGYEVKGATRWISIFGVSMQPSEFIKPFFTVVIGWILSLKFENEFPSFSICIFLYSLVAILLIIQPDFGMLVMITTVFCIQLFIAGMPIFWIFFALIVGIFGVIGAYFWLPHVTKRIDSFLDPNIGENYQITKSIMSFKHGGLYGQGPGEGYIKQFLPDAHTDFIFAVAGEEFGALLCILILGIFAFIVIRTLYKLINEKDKFTQLASAGIIIQFGLQAIINIGVSLNLLPTKGMTLPFISYGGSSTLATAIGIGMLIGFTTYETSFNNYKFKNRILDKDAIKEEYLK